MSSIEKSSRVACPNRNGLRREPFDYDADADCGPLCPCCDGEGVIPLSEVAELAAWSSGLCSDDVADELEGEAALANMDL